MFKATKTWTLIESTNWKFENLKIGFTNSLHWFAPKLKKKVTYSVSLTNPYFWLLILQLWFFQIWHHTQMMPPIALYHYAKIEKPIMTKQLGNPLLSTGRSDTLISQYKKKISKTSIFYHSSPLNCALGYFPDTISHSSDASYCLRLVTNFQENGQNLLFCH